MHALFKKADELSRVAIGAASYMKLLDIPLGLIINFHEMKLIDGIVRMILPGANR